MSMDLPIRTFARALLASLLLAAGLLAPAGAQDVSARIKWYGVYTTSKSETVKDPASPTGQRFVLTPVAPKQNSERIPGRDDVQFGLSYVLSGNGGRNVTVRQTYLFPGDGMPDAATGKRVDRYEYVREDAIGDSVLMGWSFTGAPPERLLLGDWIFQLWMGDRKLLEKRFTVYRP